MKGWMTIPSARTWSSTPRTLGWCHFFGLQRHWRILTPRDSPWWIRDDVGWFAHGGGCCPFGLVAFPQPFYVMGAWISLWFPMMVIWIYTGSCNHQTAWNSFPAPAYEMAMAKVLKVQGPLRSVVLHLPSPRKICLQEVPSWELYQHL